MIQVKEILKLSLFKNFKILCGRQYLQNAVTAAVILEFESSRINYEGYDYGYFVLISYFFASTNPALVNNSIRTLIEKHVSGIALKIAPEETLPEDIVKLALRNHVPIVTFYEEFMEDLIVCINESMRTRAQYIINEERLNRIMTGNCPPEEVRQIALDINPAFSDTVISASMIPKGETSNLLIHTYFDRLMYRKYQITGAKPYAFVKSHLGMFFIGSIEEKTRAGNVEDYVMDILEKNQFRPEQFYIGISDEPFSLSDLHISVVKARNANVIGKYLELSLMKYSHMGIYQYIMAIVNDHMLYSDIEKKIAVLEEYDKEHNSGFLETLISYVNHNCDYGKTAEDCYQHANTIRYRIKKAASMLEIEQEQPEEELMLLIRSYLIHQVLNQYF